MFILIASQYWVTSYATDILGGDSSTVYIMFVVVILSGPALGALIGGMITTRLLGSYTNPKALPVCMGVYLMFVGFCIGCTFVDDAKLYMLLLWMAVFS